MIKLTLFLALLIYLIPFASAGELSGTKPNIIVMMTDDQGYGPVGRHGHPWIKTPNLDRMYDKSTRFDRFLVSPTCTPTRAAMMSGRHPMKNGITHTILERERMALSTVTLPQVLKKSGYTTGIFGKWHLGDEEAYQPHNRGFDEAFIHGAGGIGQAYNCSCADAPGNKYFDPVIRHNGSFVKTKGYCTDLFFTSALGWIKQVKDKEEPFFAYITTNAPHGPFIAPPKNTKRFTDLGFKKGPAGFYGMIENIDENYGRMLDQLEKWGLLENTLVIFMSDNGMTGGGSGRGVVGQAPDGKKLEAYNAGMKGQKGSPEEGGVRVPFFVRWDGKIKPGQDIDRIAAHIDLMPTLVDLAGGELPKGQVEGRSLVPLIENPKIDWEDRYLFTHVARWKTGENPDKSQWGKFAVRNQRFRMVGEKSLFDMEKDPGQKTNVFDQYPEVVKDMRAAYEKFWKETKPLMVNESAPMSPVRPFHELFKKQTEAGGIPDWKPPVLDAENAALKSLPGREISKKEREDILFRAAAALKEYTGLETWQERMHLVRDPARVTSLMEKYYADNPDGALGDLTIGNEVSFISRGDGIFVFFKGEKEVVDGENEQFVFVVELVEGDDPGFLFDWEVLVNYEPIEWDEFRKSKIVETAPFRIRARKGDYYNAPFLNSSEYVCYALTPMGRVDEIFGYVKRGSDLAEELEELVIGNRALILELRFPEEAKFDNIVEIADLVSDGWLGDPTP